MQHAPGPGITALLGIDHEPENAASAIEERVHPDDRADFDRIWSHATLLESNGQIVEQHYRLIGHDGVVRWLRDTARITVTAHRVFLNGASDRAH